MNFKKVLNVTDVSREDITDILTGFISYGSYWCTDFTYDEDTYTKISKELDEKKTDDTLCHEDVLSEMIIRGSDIKLKDCDGDTHTLNLDKLIVGIERSVAENYLSENVNEWDAGDHDTIIQLAIWEDGPVYG